MHLVLVGAATAVWCLFHSLLIGHRWRGLIQRRCPGLSRYRRLAYALGSTISLAVLLLWIRTLPETMIWSWTGGWSWLRWAGLAEAGFLFWQGARIYDGLDFLGLRHVTDPDPSSASEPPLRTDGVLGTIRHPWYSGAILLLVFGQSVTDVNLVWRAVLVVYILIGTELEERKLLADLGEVYADYRRRVPRFVPIRWR